MAIIGGNTEKKEIGLPIGVSGTHDNTKIDDTTGFLKLIESDVDANGNYVYVLEGSWTSDVVDLGDIFQDFEKVFVTNHNSGSSSFAVLTRVSDNGKTWSDWTPIALDGTIQSDTKQYIQVRIDLFAGFQTDSFLIDGLDFESNPFVKIDSTAIKLNREYEYNMDSDSTWSDDGSLHRKKITREEWVRIDRLQVVE